jgi:hypothetical protein
MVLNRKLVCKIIFTKKNKKNRFCKNPVVKVILSQVPLKKKYGILFKISKQALKHLLINLTHNKDAANRLGPQYLE